MRRHRNATKGPTGASHLSTAVVGELMWGLQVGEVMVATTTASTTGFVLARDGARPSRTTIARAVPPPAGVAAPCAIIHDGQNRHETQPWPELDTRTKAPCHTRTVSPPGSPTSVLHWKALPEGRASGHEDENGAAAYITVVRVTSAMASTVVVVARLVVRGGGTMTQTLRKRSGVQGGAVVVPPVPSSLLTCILSRRRPVPTPMSLAPSPPARSPCSGLGVYVSADLDASRNGDTHTPRPHVTVAARIVPFGKRGAPVCRGLSTPFHHGYASTISISTE